jgi:hypothetical protein
VCIQLGAPGNSSVFLIFESFGIRVKISLSIAAILQNQDLISLHLMGFRRSSLLEWFQF